MSEYIEKYPLRLSADGRKLLGCNPSFTGDLVIPEGVEIISREAYISPQKIRGNVYLPKSLKYIGQEAFGRDWTPEDYCQRAIKLPPNVIVESWAFYECNLSKVYVPEEFFIKVEVPEDLPWEHDPDEPLVLFPDVLLHIKSSVVGAVQIAQRIICNCGIPKVVPYQDKSTLPCNDTITFHGDKVKNRNLSNCTNDSFNQLLFKAQDGDPESAYLVGKCYLTGMHVEKDVTKGLLYTLFAAGHKNASAIFNVAMCFYKGIGVSKNDACAEYWFYRAKQKGSSRASEILKKYFNVY